jgi:hypothetical protein
MTDRLSLANALADGKIDSELRSEMALLEQRLLIRFGGLMVVPPGLFFAALRYLPPAY